MKLRRFGMITLYCFFLLFFELLPPTLADSITQSLIFSIQEGAKRLWGLCGLQWDLRRLVKPPKAISGPVEGRRGLRVPWGLQERLGLGRAQAEKK